MLLDKYIECDEEQGVVYCVCIWPREKVRNAVERRFERLVGNLAA